MKSLGALTFFVAFVLFSAAKASAETQSPVTFALRMAGEAVEQPGIEPQVALGSMIDYKFYSSYSIGAEFAFFRPFNQFDEQAFDGFDDVGAYLMDSDLWSSKWYGLTLQFKATAIFPTSQPSKIATMEYGGSESLILKKDWGAGLTTNLVFAVSEFQYKYAETIYKDDQVSNTPVTVMEKVIIGYDILRDLHYGLFGMLKTYYDYNDSRYNIYTVGTQFTYDIQKNTSIDIGVRSAVKQAGTPDPWNGPYTSTSFLGPEGTIFFLGTTIKI